jgi:hypothetical protein
VDKCALVQGLLPRRAAGSGSDLGSASAGFRTARRTLAGFEAMAMIRKGQIRKIGGRDIRGQAIFIIALFDTAA